MKLKTTSTLKKSLLLILFIFIQYGGYNLFAQTTYNDEFNSVSYSNNDGSATFASDWIETDANGGGVVSGNIFVSNDRLTFDGLQSTDNLYRNIDLSAASSVSITTRYNSASRGNARLELQIRQNDGTWRELSTIQVTSSSSTQNITISGAAFLHSNSGFRFAPVASAGDWAPGEIIHIDYIRIGTDISNNSTDAEVKRPFAPRFSENINGDFTYIANTTIGTHPTTPYNGTGGNSSITTEFIDIDSDTSTFNSSNAVFNNPNPTTSCLNYRKVFLYWAASNKEYSANTGDGGPEPIWNFDDVKLMLPGSSTYTTYTADEVIYNGRAEHFENDPVILFKDITADVDALGSPYGTYQIGNVKGAEGVLRSHSGSNTGTSGGWQIVFIYESFDLAPKNVTLLCPCYGF